MIPNQIAPMWGLIIDDQRDINEHATWWTSRNLDQSQLDLFIDMLKGKKCGSCHLFPYSSFNN